MRGSILVAEDEATARSSLVEILNEEGYQVYEAADGQAAVQLLEELDLDLVLCDLKMPGSDGLTVLRQVRERAPQTLVLLMTAYGSVETAVEALRWGVQDYLLKPLLFEDLLHKIDRLLTYKQQAWELQLLRREVNQDAQFERLVGRSPAMQEVTRLVKKVAPTNATVLLTGESGTGKEVVARLLHAHSERKDHVFLPINCSAIPETLLESQLFGHTRGAFTGAAGAHDGLFQRARGARFSWTKLVNSHFPCKPNCCAWSRRKKSCRSARPLRSRSMSVFWLRPTGISSRKLRAADFAKTCITVCTLSAWPSRRYATVAKTSPP